MVNGQLHRHGLLTKSIAGLLALLLLCHSGYAGFGDCGSDDGDFSDCDASVSGGGSPSGPCADGAHCDPDGDSFDTFDLESDFSDWIGWIPWPKFDYFRRRSILQLSHPEDRMYFSKQHQIYGGAAGNPHKVTDEKIVLAGVSIVNSNVATFGGFGPGIAYYYRGNKSYTQSATSYETANQSTTPKLPHTYEDIESWPEGATMVYGSTHYGQLVLMAGAFFTGVDAGLLAKKGFVVRITKKQYKFTVSFITRSSLGAKVGAFLGLIARSNKQGLRHRIHTYTFEFSHQNPTEKLKEAVNSLLGNKHDLKPAFELALEPDSGIRAISENKEAASERNSRMSLGIPIVVRLTKGSVTTRSLTDRVAKGEKHRIYSINNVEMKKKRFLRKRRPDSSEPRIMHHQSLRQRVATATIDWQEGVGPKLKGHITYIREMDQAGSEKINESIFELSQKLHTQKLEVAFPKDLPKGDAVIKLDVILEQGSLYTLMNLARKDPERFRSQAEAGLHSYIYGDKSKHNSFYYPERNAFSTKKAAKALAKTLKDINSVIEKIKDCRPARHNDSSFEKERIEDLEKIGYLMKRIAKNPLLIIALRSFDVELVKYHYEIMGERFNPYTINF